MPLAWTKLNGLHHSDRHPALSSTHITCPYYLVNISPRESILPYVKVPILIITFRKWMILLVQIYWSRQCSLPPPTHGSSICPSGMDRLPLVVMKHYSTCHCHP